MGRKIVEAPTDPESCLIRLIFWTHLVNGLVAIRVFDVPPFPYVRESLEKLAPAADVICVSATPYEALVREWEEHDIAGFAALICGQEQGKKAEHICLATGGKLDGKGDMKAAKANNALFYPVMPGRETESWQRFHDEACDRFLNDEYAGDYEEQLLAEFERCLPETPPWKQ